MAINFSDLVGGGGGGGLLITKFFSASLQLPTSGSSTVTIPAPAAGQRIVITGLTSNIQGGPFVTVSGSNTGVSINNKQLSSTPTSGYGVRFAVGMAVVSGISASGGLPELVFGEGESVLITSTDWSVGGGTNLYSYAYKENA